MTDIPASVATPSDKDGEQLPRAVAELPQDVQSPEANPYVISFAKYNEGLCEINLLNSNKARRALETLKAIGTKIRSSADFQRHHIDQISVRGEGAYRRLYNGLANDIQLREIKLQQDARIFYFDIEPQRTLYVVAITENHFETRQVRR
jgi:hypothetical protein